MKAKGSMARTRARQTDSLTSRLLLRFLVGRCSFHSIRAGVIQARISALPKSVYFWCLCVLKQLPRGAWTDGPQHMVPLSARALRHKHGSPAAHPVSSVGTLGPDLSPPAPPVLHKCVLHHKTSSSAGKNDTR